MNKNILSILITFLSLNIAGFGQTNILIPKEFVETIPPDFGTPDWYSLNYSKNEFGVKNVNGNLEVIKVKEVHKSEFKLPNGILTAIDHGEFGGDLTFNPFDSTKPTVRIKGGNIKFIFDYRNKIYFIDGLAHGGSSKGTMYELDTANARFKYKKVLHFEDAPEAFAIYDDKFLVATHENFYIVKNFKKELIFKKTFWASLYPNSIAAFDDVNIIVGIRGGIVKIDLVKKNFKFYKNAD